MSDSGTLSALRYRCGMHSNTAWLSPAELGCAFRAPACRRPFGRPRPNASHLGVTALQYPHDRPAALSLSATISQYFIGGMMPESANPVEQPQTIIEIRPY